MANNYLQKIQEKSERFYDTPIGKLPSVTTILALLNKPAIVNWAVKMTISYLSTKLDDIREGKLTLTEENASDILKEAKAYHNTLKEQAADIGTQVHALIEAYLQGEKISFADIENADKIQSAFDAFLKWEKDNEFTCIKTEHPVYSLKGYAGTLDIVGKLKKKLYIIDLKTSNSLWPEMLMQVGAYLFAYEERTGDKIKGCGILRLGKEDGLPEFKPFTRKEAKYAYKRFLKLAEYYHLTKGGKGNG